MNSERGAGLGLSICLLVLLFPRDANAYLDPGSGSYVFQLLVAGMLGGLFVLKMFWKRVKNFIRRLFERKAGDGNRQP